MNKLTGNAIIGQSGGPTSVINSSLAGVIDAAMKSSYINHVYGMNYGFEGFMQHLIFDLSNQPRHIIEGLRNTPSSALGSSRQSIGENDFPKILEILKKNNIRYFFQIGGNGSMDVVNRVVQYCRNNKYELIGVGIPKTVDNDLFGTDHAPGFASAARSNILNVMQVGILARDMKKVDQFMIYQTIGRDAGWLVAATAAARQNEEDAPHLIYTPELPFSRNKFLTDFQDCYQKFGWVSVVCGEGIKYGDGSPVSAPQITAKFQNIEFGATGGSSVALNLHKMISEEFKLRGEFQITESLIMSAKDRQVQLDDDEAYRCGIEAVKLAEKGESDYMVTLERVSNNPYRINYGKVLLSDVAAKTKPMPLDYFNANGNVNDKFLEYIRPLVGELPKFVELEKKFIK
jgi:6-phosphofructokinase 1